MAEQTNMQTDMRLLLRHSELRPVYDIALKRHRGPRNAVSMWDFATAEGKDNLSQAAVMRLLTPRGELKELGHPEYGSRLHELVGKEQTSTTRSLIKLYILESLYYEARIEKINYVKVSPVAENPFRVDVEMGITPVGDESAITVGPITLEL